jgi:Smg protein
MKEDVFEVLLYLFENYMIEGADLQPDQDMLTAELHQAGFGHGEINKAFDWLEDLSSLCEQHTEPLPGGAASSFRHLAPDEEMRIDPTARGLILSLEQAGVLEPDTRELVLDRLMALETDEIDLDHVKWVIMMVLCNRPDREAVLAWAEDLVLDGIGAHLH